MRAEVQARSLCGVGRVPRRQELVRARSSSAVSSAAGTASRRSSGIGCPLSIERPYVPAASRSSARSTAASWSRRSSSQAFVELVLVEVGGEIRRVVLVGGLAVVLVPEPGERAARSAPVRRSGARARGRHPRGEHTRAKHLCCP